MCEHMEDYGQVLMAIRNYIFLAYVYHTAQEERWQEKNPPHTYACVGHRYATACMRQPKTCASRLILVQCEYDEDDITACAVRVYELVNWTVV